MAIIEDSEYINDLEQQKLIRQLKKFMVDVNNADADTLYTLVDDINIFIAENKILSIIIDSNENFIKIMLQEDKNFIYITNSFLDCLIFVLKSKQAEIFVNQTDIEKALYYLKQIKQREDFIKPIFFDANKIINVTPLEKCSISFSINEFDFIQGYYVSNIFKIFKKLRKTKFFNFYSDKGITPLYYKHILKTCIAMQTYLELYFLKRMSKDPFCTVSQVIYAKKQVIIDAICEIINLIPITIENYKDIISPGKSELSILLDTIKIRTPRLYELYTLIPDSKDEKISRNDLAKSMDISINTLDKYCGRLCSALGIIEEGQGLNTLINFKSEKNNKEVQY